MKNIGIWLTHPEVICWNLNRRQFNLIKNLLPHTNLIFCHTEEDFIKILPQLETAIIWTFKQEWFKKAPYLKYIVTPAAGKDLFQVEPPKGIELIYSSFHGELIAETVLGMILAHARGIMRSFQIQTTPAWSRLEMDKVMLPLRGAHVVILGFGNIGQWIARLCKLLGVRITGIKNTLIPLPDFMDKNDHILTVAKLDTVLSEADHLVLAIPGTAATTDIIDARRLSLLPRHAAIYNVGRGNAINEAALLTALKQKRISAAYLDVFKQEPLSPDSPLRRCLNCYIMPHASAISPNYLDLFIKEFVEKYKRGFK